ncbi:MAG: right-handed parallel beta-helix repeat-containing protein, partial [Candidatus Thorarchaeota archaeon]
MNNKNQKFALVAILFLTGSIIAVTLSTNFYVSGQIGVIEDYDPDSLRISAIFGDITIDALLTTNTATNGNWTWAKSIGICTGLGTSGSPYIIQGHTFDNTYAMDDCLRILNSREHFIIQDCTFISAGFMSAGLYLNNVTNGRILNSFSNDNYIGIEMEFVNNTEISGSHIYDTTAGLVVDNSNFNIISNNNVSANLDIGIYLTQSTFNTISYNIINDNQNYPGIWLVSLSDNNGILHNTVNSNGLSGISIDSSNDNDISYNEANDNTESGIQLGDANRNTLL